MYLFFDTETTGLPKSWRAPLEALDNWPRLVQLAWLLTDKDGKKIVSKNRTIKPEGFEIPEQAAKVHGITTDIAQKEGISLVKALGEFAESLENSKVLVAHNIKFDEKIMGAEFLRQKIESKLFDIPQVCTMHAATDFCKIPNNFGYKWPKLMELHEKLFDECFDDAHDALADVKACAKCFFALKEKGVV